MNGHVESLCWINRRASTRIVVALLAIALVASACGSDGDPVAAGDDEAGTDGVASAEVEGVDDGCGPFFAMQEFFSVTEAVDRDAIEGVLDDTRDAIDVAEGESDATVQLLEMYEDVWVAGLDTMEGDSPVASDEFLGQAIIDADLQLDELEDLAAEAGPYVQRVCGLDLFSEASGSNEGDSRAAEVAGADAGSTTTSTTIPIEAVLEVEEDSSGASRNYAGVTLEVGEIWRTNQDPVEVLQGGGEGTESEMVMVGVRFTNEGTSRMQFDPSAVRWMGADGSLTDATTFLTEQGESEFSIVLEASSSVAVYVVFPDPGPTTDAALYISRPEEEPESIPLGGGASESENTLTLDDGDSGSAFVQFTSVCGFGLDTEVRSVEISPNAEDRDGKGLRAGRDRLLVSIDLAVTMTEGADTLGCPNFVPVNALDTRLSLSSGDQVAPTELSFASAELRSTVVDSLVFDVPADFDELSLTTVEDNDLGTWTDIELP